MGYICHHTIVVSSSTEGSIEAAHKRAEGIFRWVSPISPSAGNGERSFFIPPDGSKEGWPGSQDGDARRHDFLAWVEEARAHADESRLDWCEVIFGDEAGNDRLVRSGRVDNRNERDLRLEPSGDEREYVGCPTCGYRFVVYTYEFPDETVQAVGGYESEAGIFCEGCDTSFEYRPGLGWVPEGTPVAAPGPRSRIAPLGE